MNFLSNVTNRIPVVGHFKGLIHYTVGDFQGGDEAVYQATKSTAIVAAANTGALFGGPAGFVAAGFSAGASFDHLASKVTEHKPHGYFEVYRERNRTL